MTTRTRAIKINKIKFLSVNRDIKAACAEDKYYPHTLAHKHGLSVSTIRSIKRAKTWPGFLTAKQLTITLTARGKAAVFAKAQAAPTEKLARGLRKLESHPVDYITTKQFTDALDSMKAKLGQDRSRADLHHERLDNLERDNRVTMRFINRIQQLKPRWFRES